MTAAVPRPLHPAHPERICRGYGRYCAAGDLRCGNGTDRAQHPIEIFGSDWRAYGLDVEHLSDAGTPVADAPRQTPRARK